MGEMASQTVRYGGIKELASYAACERGFGKEVCAGLALLLTVGGFDGRPANANLRAAASAWIGAIALHGVPQYPSGTRRNWHRSDHLRLRRAFQEFVSLDSSGKWPSPARLLTYLPPAKDSENPHQAGKITHQPSPEATPEQVKQIVTEVAAQRAARERRS